MQLWNSLYSAYLVLDDNMIFDSQIKHLLVPFHKAFVFRNFLLNGMAMKNVVISFTRWTSPYVSHLISVTRSFNEIHIRIVENGSLSMSENLIIDLCYSNTD